MRRSYVGVMMAQAVLAPMLFAQQPVVTADRAVPNVAAIETLLARPVTMHVVRVPLARAIDAVAASAQVLVQYRAAVVEAYTAPVTLQVSKESLRTVLERLLAGTTLQVVPDGATQLSIVETHSRDSHTVTSGTITGRATDATSKQPLSGVKIGLDGTERMSETGTDGTFRMAGVSAGPHTVTLKLLGYMREVRTVTAADEQTITLAVALSPSVNALEQVVVTGTVVQTELKAVPNAITVITAKQIEERGITRIDQLFRGNVPGLFSVGPVSNNPLDQVKMASRGATALGGDFSQGGALDQPIKTYVNGVELADPSYLNQIDPQSIERIEILSGPQASTIYGSNAINGVMQIFTKRGIIAHPQLSTSLASGFVQNNFSSALTPQHAYSGQLDGVEGHMSYNAGGSWNYVGAWTPAKRTARTTGFGGTRIQWDHLTLDANARLGVTRNWQEGAPAQPLAARIASGAAVARFGAILGPSAPATSTLNGQTWGFTASYTPRQWWSHEFVVGSDASDAATLVTAPGYLRSSDTLVSLSQTHNERASIRYVTTIQFLMSSLVQSSFVIGGDGWNNIITSITATPSVLTGTLNGSPSLARQPGHNRGMFLQGQMGVDDALFVTYGLRAEWNPNYGDAIEPNMAPRYGVAYTANVGALTTKLRASYGRSTRPPTPDQKGAQHANSQYWGSYDFVRANPNLEPEFQRGGEGGLEVYFGSRASLSVTRYNQTVEGLIAQAKVDSLDLLPEWVTNFGRDVYAGISQNLNLGAIRNQGWETQGTARIGLFTVVGEYSWTKSRTIGINPKYQSQFDQTTYPARQPGASFGNLPEHTWSMNITYANAATRLLLAIQGIGPLYRSSDALSLLIDPNVAAGTRLDMNKPRIGLPLGYRAVGPGYTLADFTASHRLTGMMEGVVQVQNLTNFYQSDLGAALATLGRQVKAGWKIRWQ